MDLWELVRTFARHPFVVVPMLVITLVASVLAGRGAGESFEASGSILLLGPPPVSLESTQDEDAEDEPPPSNVYAGDLRTTAQTIAIIVDDPVSKERVREQGGSGAYQLTTSNRTPIVGVVATGDTADEAALTVEQVVALFARELDRRQQDADVPPEQRLRVQQLDRLIALSAVLDGSTRALLGMLAAGLTATVLAVSLAEGLRRRRLGARAALHPHASALATAQDRLLAEREMLLRQRAALEQQADDAYLAATGSVTGGGRGDD